LKNIRQLNLDLASWLIDRRRCRHRGGRSSCRENDGEPRADDLTFERLLDGLGINSVNDAD
jgi:hypothetical protein